MEKLDFLNDRTVSEAQSDEFGYEIRFKDGSLFRIGYGTVGKLTAGGVCETETIAYHEFSEDGDLDG